MSFSDCMQRGIDAGLVDHVRGKRAQERWEFLKDQYVANGRPEQVAMVMAAKRITEEADRAAKMRAHAQVSTLAVSKRLNDQVNALPKKDLKKFASRSVESLDYEARSLVRLFNGKFSAFLRQNHRKITGSMRNPAMMKNIVMELHGQSTGDEAAAALAAGIRQSMEEMRVMFNEAGGYIGKLDNWGMPHSHNRLAITRAGFEEWFGQIKDMLDWERIEDYSTGQPFQAKGAAAPPDDVKRAFLKEVYDNIDYGQGSREANYGRAQGQALYKARSEQRVLHFVDGEAWMQYNQRFGSGDPFKSLMSHIHGMAYDIAAMRRFTPNPNLGVDYMNQLVTKRMRETGERMGLMDDAETARRMMRIFSGPTAPKGAAAELTAGFLSSARHFMTAAFLDRAVVASISDFNSMRLAAKAFGLNRRNIVSAYTKTLADMAREGTMQPQDLLRHQWVMDTVADPGAATARFQQEIAPSEVAERLSSASMRLQGLTHHTDTLKFAIQTGFWGAFAEHAGRPLSELPDELQVLLRKHDLTDDEWAIFAAPENLYEAGNGATFLNPLHWRAGRDGTDAAADQIFMKVQGAIEEVTEIGVPTQSLLGKSFFDPTAFGLPPGSVGYEVLKSGSMFKSFVAAFTVNQVRMIAAQPTTGGKISYGLNMAGGATILGAMSLLIGDLIAGRDPANANPAENPMFWAKAAMKGGGFAIVGDIIATGQASWGGGFGSYAAGPVPQLMDDAWGLTIKNAYDFATGGETNFASDLSRVGRRYMPMAQTPLVGPAVDRLFWDQLQLFLDPDSITSLQSSETRRSNRDGNGAFWSPGSPLPSRAPDFMDMLGG